MALLTVPNTFADGAVIDDDPLNANFAAIVNALSGGVENIEFVINFSGSSPVLILNQKGSGEIAKFQLNGVDKVKVLNNGQIESTVATGTAPLIIASTTKVVNLNADQLDGHEATEYVPKAGTTLTGFLTLHASPSSAMHAANKQYVDTVVGGVFPSGTKLLFGNAPPSGWTRVDASEDRLIKLAKSGETLGTAGGSWTISGFTISGYSLQIADLPAHNHGLTYTSTISLLGGGALTAVTALATTGLASSVNTANTGSGTAHTHSISHDGTWRPRYEIWAAATKN